MVPYKTFDWSGSQPIEFNDECPHVEAVTVIQGDRITQVNPDGVDDLRGPAGKSLSGRGTCICLTFFTEECRRYFVLYQFHKGSVERVVLGPDDIESSDLPELWRD